MAQEERTAMRVTTVRFGAELWTLLEQAAERDGTSVSQYIREAALARAAFAAGRGDAPLDLVVRATREVATTESNHDLEFALAALVRVIAGDRQRDAIALREESRQAARQTRRLRKTDVP